MQQIHEHIRVEACSSPSHDDGSDGGETCGSSGNLEVRRSIIVVTAA
jgi:hypothetical protein